VVFAKKSPDNIILVLVNLDPHNAQSGFAYVPLEIFGLNGSDPFQVKDLLTGEMFVWNGCRNFVIFDPHTRPAHVFRLRRLIARRGVGFCVKCGTGTYWSTAAGLTKGI
jgi:starch synthase (maltosyl-transferring)